MIAVYLGTCFTAMFSAFVPITAIEPYIVGLAATTGCHPVGLGVAAALGQTVGKTAVFLGARGALRSAWMRRWVDAAKTRLARKRARAAVGAVAEDGAASAAVDGTADQPKDETEEPRGGPLRRTARKLTELLDRPVLTAPILFLSAVIGMPPLLATCVYTAHTRISTPMFVTVCLAGRSIRFIALAYAPGLIMG